MKAKAKRSLVFVSAFTAGLVLLSSRRIPGQAGGQPVVRLAEIEVETSSLQTYKQALREEIETSIRVEPGVLTLYAVSVKERPNQIRLFEVYASPAAYEAHLKTAHFRKYKLATAQMVTSLKLLDADPVMLGAR